MSFVYIIDLTFYKSKPRRRFFMSKLRDGIYGLAINEKRDSK